MTFALISLLAVPLILMNFYGGNFNQQGIKNNSETKWAFSLMSLGNLGGTESRCLHQFYENDSTQKMMCHTGDIHKLTFAGIIPDHDDFSEKAKLQINDFCSPIDTLKDP